MDLSRTPIRSPGGPTASQRALPKLDLLRYASIRALLRSRLYPGVFQWPTLAVFLLIMAVAL